MQKILVAEDNRKLSGLMVRYLTSHGFEAVPAFDGEEAIRLFQETPFDLVLLDVMMPKMDGFEVCKELRKTSRVPVIFLTALAGEEDQLTGYGTGADDYIVKPFSLPVLLAKCNALLNRLKVQEEWLEHGGIRLNEEKRIALAGENALSLSSMDFDLLKLFLQNPGVVLMREQIILRLWGYDYEGYDRSVDTHVKTLRKALGPYGKAIRTVVRKGYVLD